MIRMKLQEKKDKYGRKQLFLYVPSEYAQKVGLFKRPNILCLWENNGLSVQQQDSSPFIATTHQGKSPMAVLMISAEFTKQLGWHKGDDIQWKIEGKRLLLWR